MLREMEIDDRQRTEGIAMMISDDNLCGGRALRVCRGGRKGGKV